MPDTQKHPDAKPLTPPMATINGPVRPQDRPEAAGEPEPATDGTAGRTGLREQIDAAIRRAGNAAYGQQPFYEAITDAVLAVRDRRMEQLAAGRETWKAKAAEIERDRDRLANEVERHVTANLEAAERAQRVIEALRTSRARIAEAHSKNHAGGGMTSGDCDECALPWPCPTNVWATTDRDALATWDPADDEEELAP